MSYVYANVDEGGAFVLYQPMGAVQLRRNEVWFADDPFVAFRPDLFSETPVLVSSTTGKLPPEPTPVGAPKPRKARGR